VIPASTKNYEECLEIGVNTFNSLKKLLLSKNLSTLIADEGGFSPKLATNQDALVALKLAVEAINLRLGFDIFFGLDVASSNLYSEQKYHIKDKSNALSGSDLIDYYELLNKDFHFLYLEDGLAEDDWDNWPKLCERLSKDTIIVGDDLTATNPVRLQTAIDKKAISGILIKPNQIGTVIEALAVVEMAKHAGQKIIVSHRSGETNDDFIADFAVAVSADYCKFGAPQRGERIAKYNRLLQINDQLKTL
jgi:enolase